MYDKDLEMQLLCHNYRCLTIYRKDCSVAVPMDISINVAAGRHQPEFLLPPESLSPNLHPLRTVLSRAQMAGKPSAEGYQTGRHDCGGHLHQGAPLSPWFACRSFPNSRSSVRCSSHICHRHTAGVTTGGQKGIHSPVCPGENLETADPPCLQGH